MHIQQSFGKNTFYRPTTGTGRGSSIDLQPQKPSLGQYNVEPDEGIHPKLRAPHIWQ